MSGMIYVIVPCLCNEVSGMSEVICAILCLCNEAWGMHKTKTGAKRFVFALLHKHGTAQITSDIH
jgi:hypothetical protein